MNVSVETINSWLDQLDHLERELRAIPLRYDGVPEECAAEFERIHRIALKTAGIVRDRENSERKRPLPLSVWASLKRCGGVHAVRALEVEPFVQARQRAESSAQGAAAITPELVADHRRGTLGYISVVRDEIMGVEEIAA